MTPSEPWNIEVQVQGSSAALSGAYTRHERAKGLVIIIPGLGASPKSAYCKRAALTLLRAGYSSLRLGNTLCSQEQPDFHRSQLAYELTEALAHKPLSRYQNVYILGYSMGGHSALRAAADGLPKQVRAVAVVSTPFDLALSQAHIDAAPQLVYRRFLISLLNEIYQTESSRGNLPQPPDALAHAESLRDYDAILIASRDQGHRCMDTYYKKASARWVLNKIEKPVLAIISPNDPMIPQCAVETCLEGQAHSVDLRWAPGGHIYFPDHTDLGEAGPKGLIQQIITWWEHS